MSPCENDTPINWKRNLIVAWLGCFLTGAADGALLPAVQTLLVYNSSNQIAGRIFSYNQSFRDIGNVTGPLMGAAISANYGFRAVFLVTAGVVLFNAVYSWNSLRRRRIPQVSN